MAINDVFNSLEFDGVNSLSNDVFITGEAVYDAPERDVEMIEIPGRNGDFQLDNGRWKNIEVSYKAGVFGSDQNEFATKIRNYRNLLASRIGYKRLTDTYNPDEYRLGTFVNALEAKSASRKRAGEFDIVFNCKPQRWLTSGEQEITVTSGGTVTNPTPYDASPLLMVEGYGNIGFNDYSIDIENVMIGQITLAAPHSFTSKNHVAGLLHSSQVNNGDLITVSNVGTEFNFSLKSNGGQILNCTVSDSSNTFASSCSTVSQTERTVRTRLNYSLNYQKGTAASFSNTVTVRGDVKDSGGTTHSYRFTCDIAIDANATATNIAITRTISGTETYVRAGSVILQSRVGIVVADSTKSALGNPTYIDCDLGEAYMIQDGSVVSLNQHIDLGSDLPVLSPGANTFTYSNGITSLKVVPRWWIL
jgi:phage-related protein